MKRQPSTVSSTRVPTHLGRRAGAVVAGGALLAASLLVGPLTAPAAAAEETAWETATDASAFARSAGVECTLLGESSLQVGNPAPGTTERHTVAEDYLVTNLDDPADTQELDIRGSSTLRRTDAAGALATVVLRADATISGSVALGEVTECRSRAAYESELESLTELPSDGFIELTVRSTDEMQAVVGFFQESTSTGATVTSGPGLGPKRSVVAGTRTFVEAGPVEVFGAAGLGFSLPAPSVDERAAARLAESTSAVTGTAYAEVRFVKAGSASRATGAGGRFVSLGQRSCAADTVTTRTKPKVRRARTVTYFVDGKRVKRLSTPKPRRVVRLGLDPVEDSTVTVVVKPKAGKTVTVTRSYVACRG